MRVGDLHVCDAAGVSSVFTHITGASGVRTEYRLIGRPPVSSGLDHDTSTVPPVMLANTTLKGASGAVASAWVENVLVATAPGVPS